MKKQFLIVALLFPSLAHAQGSLLPFVEGGFIDSLGVPVASGFICATISGTTTNLATYPTQADANAGTNPNSNPVALDSAGRASIFIGTGTYRIVLLNPVGIGSGSCNGTATGSAIRTVNGVAGFGSLLVANNTWTGTNNFKNVNSVQMCDQATGADYGIKVNACLALAGSGSGVADARGFTGAQSTSTTISIPANTTLLIGEGFTSTASPAINCAGDGAAIIGLSKNSKITYSTSLANGINCSSNNAIIHNVHLYGNNASSTGIDGVGVYATGVSNLNISQSYFEQAGSGSIVLVNVNSSLVADNVISNSTNKSTQNDSGISIRDNSVGNIVRHNSVQSDNSFGIDFRTITAGTTLTDNIMDGNVVSQKEEYGLLFYKTNLTDTMKRNKAIGNTVRDIQGSVLNSVTSTKNFGACIYEQGNEDFLVTGNHLSNCNVQTVADSLAPGAIGATSVSAGVISGNFIDNTQWYGITVRDPNQQGAGSGTGDSFVPLGGIVVSDNEVNGASGSMHGMFHVLDHHNVTLTGNIGYGSGSQGLIVRISGGGNYTYLRNISAVGNIFKKTGDIALTANDTRFSQYVNNVLADGSATGLAINNGQNIKLSGNTVTGFTGQTGVIIQGTTTNCQAFSNTVSANTTGMNVASTCWLGDDNLVTGNTSDWTGTYQLWQSITGATPDVAAAKYLKITDGTSKTNFLNGIVGQNIVVYLGTAVTIVHNASNIVMQDNQNFVGIGGEVLNFRQFTTGIWTETGRAHPPFQGTSASIGGGALLAGVCATGSLTVTGASTGVGQVAIAEPQTYPGDTIYWKARVTGSNQVTVYVCTATGSTPTASLYNVRVIQ